MLNNLFVTAFTKSEYTVDWNQDKALLFLFMPPFRQKKKNAKNWSKLVLVFCSLSTNQNFIRKVDIAKSNSDRLKKVRWKKQKYNGKNSN